MTEPAILDSGPLVAYLHRQDKYHVWAQAHFASATPPLLTCEAVISEACFLLRGVHGGGEAVLDLLATGAVSIAFSLDEEHRAVRQLLSHYANVPMSLADGCLVRMAEKFPQIAVMTFDSDFTIYRKHRRLTIPLLMPKET